ncbi:AfsR/SARP family transcriptional regulator [Saccharothrix syringae]|uniref:AfsR/SARP family transcriptional regulator n=1 Tax=Saccharothrix syringae TaxID=103733 RepID=UPI000525E60D|nr:BTAD domain-containing putative transcriptional regulator [Saccharothrix syringae]
MLRFRVLGDIQVVVDGVPVAIAHRQQLGVLATLLVDVNTAVPLDVLADRVWGEHPPRRPRQALYTYLSRLRTSLDGVAGVAITRGPRGYALETDPDTVDLHRFRRLVGQAGGTDDTAARCAVLTEALSLWTGPAFAGVDSPWFVGTRAVLDNEHLAARLDRYDASLALGGHDALLPALSVAADEHPLDERVAGQLLLALVRGGRRHEALHRYEALRAALAEELGVDPGPALRELHQRILTADPALAAPEPAPAAPATPVPRQLPAAPASFTGRDRELAELVDAHAGAGVLTAISGPGGIGKTWLALHWSHRFADRFPDGQLFVNLRGFDPGGQPAPPEAVLRGFLEALGVAPHAVPTGLDTLTARYRSLLADKRVLVVLDNARDTEQVVPLLPGTAAATVLVTSRDRLTGLVGAHSAHALLLDVLSPAAARALLAHRLGDARLTAEPDAVRDLIARCAGLPVALGIVAARATVHPDLPLATWADELRDEAERLDALDDGDPHASLSAVLSWSTAALDRPHAEAFGLLGAAPGPDIGVAAAAALCGLTRPRAAAVLRVLERVSLAQQHSAGRYRMHDLVRLYAGARPEPGERAAALRRLVDFYLHTAVTADRFLEPHRRPLDTAPTVPEHPYPVADNAAAMTWFAAEHACVAAAQQTAADHGWDTAAWQLAWAVNTFHIRTGRHHDLLALWQHGAAAADRVGDSATRALVHRYVGNAHGTVGDFATCSRHLVEALAVVERAGDEAGRALIHRDLAIVSEQLGDFPAALEHATRTMDIVERLDNPTWQADAHNTVGWYLARLGRYAEAHEHCEIALSQCRLHRDRNGEGNTLDTLGYVSHQRGHHADGIRYYEASAALWRELGYTHELVVSLDGCGQVHADLGNADEARSLWGEALELCVAQRRDTEADGLRQRLLAL